MKVREVMKRLQREGWYIDRMKGSHRQYHHPDKPGTVTVSGHPGDEIPPKTKKSIYDQAGWEE